MNFKQYLQNHDFSFKSLLNEQKLSKVHFYLKHKYGKHKQNMDDHQRNFKGVIF